MKRRWIWIVLAASAHVTAGAAVDDRTVEIVRYDCLTDTTRHEITLFGNGTIRVRDGLIKHEWMGLSELGPDELQAFLNRLTGEDLGESTSPEKGVEGSWVEQCELRLQLPGKPLATFRFGHYDPLGLNLSRVVHIAEELGEKVQVVKDADALPAGYVPELGDVLKRVGDGARFRIVGFTSDKKGIELRGLDVPLDVYVPKDQVRQQFTALVSKGW
ncbi:MAG TPA: hypothetical protein VF173_37145 [Thermoanaerobaculia bacterium]|nr:hypothetical protein [Thermoanaerobaculia bacterium]